MDEMNQQIADQLRTEAANWVRVGLARDEADALEQMRELLTGPAEPVRQFFAPSEEDSSNNSGRS